MDLLLLPASLLLLTFLPLFPLLRYALLDSPRDEEPHFDKLVHACGGLAGPDSGLVLAGGRAGGEFDGDFGFAGEVEVADFAVWDLERWLVGDVEGELGFREDGFAPVPAFEGVLFVLDCDVIVTFHGISHSVQILR